MVGVTDPGVHVAVGVKGVGVLELTDVGSDVVFVVGVGETAVSGDGVTLGRGDAVGETAVGVIAGAGVLVGGCGVLVDGKGISSVCPSSTTVSGVACSP